LQIPIIIGRYYTLIECQIKYATAFAIKVRAGEKNFHEISNMGYSHLVILENQYSLSAINRGARHFNLPGCERSNVC